MNRTTVFPGKHCAVLNFTQKGGKMNRLSIYFVLLLFFVSSVIALYNNAFGEEIKTEIVIIEVTDKDIKKYGRFPWSRDIHGKALNILSRYRVKGVLFDMVFSEPDSRRPEKDQQFTHAIAKANIPVFIPFFFVNPGGGIQAFPYKVKTINVIESSDVKRLKLDVLPSLPKFVESTAGTGYVNIFPNNKGILEEITTVVEWNKKYYPFIGIAIVAHYFEIDLNKIFLKEETIYFGSKKLGLTKRAGFRADFSEPFKKYKHFSYSELLEERIENKIKGKFIIIGFNATGLSDFQVTKASNRYPGTEIHATFIDYMLNDF